MKKQNGNITAYIDESEAKNQIFERALADWNKIFLDKKIQDGDVFLVTSEAEHADSDVYEDTPTVSFFSAVDDSELSKNLNSISPVDHAIFNFGRKATKQPLTSEEEAELAKLKEIQNAFEQSWGGIYFVVEYEIKIEHSQFDYSIFFQRIKDSNFFEVSFSYDLSGASDTEDSYSCSLILESDCERELTLTDVFNVLGKKEIAQNYVNFEAQIKHLIEGQKE